MYVTWTVLGIPIQPLCWISMKYLVCIYDFFLLNTIISSIRFNLFNQLDGTMPMTVNDIAHQNRKNRMELNILKKSMSTSIQKKIS